MNNKACCWVLIGLGVFMLVGMILTGVMVAGAMGGAQRSTAVPQHSYLVLDLSGLITEYRSAPRIEILVRSRPATLVDMRRALKRAENDPRIAGVIVRPIGIAGFADIRELRDVLLSFKRSGKPVYAYLDVATDRDYYLATAADTIVVNGARSGGLVMLGLSVSRTYLARTFDKLGLKFHVLTTGDFKGAYENLARERMSDSLRVGLRSMLDDLYRTYTEETAASRPSLSLSALNSELLNGERLFIRGQQAVEKQMADLVMDWSELRERLKRGDREFHSVSVNRYLRSVPPGTTGQKEIAIVFASGEINFRSSDGGVLDMDEGIYSDAMVKLLRGLREDDNVAAVVLRVNSPGGSTLASELIAQEVRRLKDTKPLVVSMGNVAASGGYYISCEASRIVAQPNTLTGSIGVVAVFPTAEELYRKIGARVETVEKGKWAEFFRVDQDLTTEREAVIRDLIGGIYDEFIERVSSGRRLTPEEVRAVAAGRVWTGTQALERKLVDELGGLDLAVQRARELAGISETEAVRIRNYPREEDVLNYVFRRLQDMALNVHLTLMPAEEREVRLALALLSRFGSPEECARMILPLDVPGCPPRSFPFLPNRQVLNMFHVRSAD